eukprot:4054554-Lingulodinium_polyedra.AAC.1
MERPERRSSQPTIKVSDGPVNWNSSTYATRKGRSFGCTQQDGHSGPNATKPTVWTRASHLRSQRAPESGWP